MPSHIFDDPKHWRQRTEQARALAEQMSDAASREMMLGIVKDYERLAEQASGRERSERRKSLSRLIFAPWRLGSSIIRVQST
jgi:hypothetical protein